MGGSSVHCDDYRSIPVSRSVANRIAAGRSECLRECASDFKSMIAGRAVENYDCCVIANVVDVAAGHRMGFVQGRF